jgi:Rrf2 family protein
VLITKETDYALRILRALASGEQLTTAALAQGEQIPQQFAYKILKKLEKAGFLQILRGKDGGCVLTADLEKITLYDLLQAMEEDSSVSTCMKPDYRCSWRSAHDGRACRAHLKLLTIQEKLDRELNSHSMREVLFGD